ncbi:L-threonylcarbamoyladenylate synthase [Candidatus Magnetomonas plexicatena]|uniref:L-threonylcarbamoyladenylate synthase n=1 Tax=Candidatus Magnetomonas plexicatena TaxID=2552947 RepID=UPI001C79714F|nr:threonylcarbamoyl-AMP synthase [Nitrospirales bacterium LBB_01]
MYIKLITLRDRDLPEVLSVAAKALSEGQIIAYPTETFYALGAAFCNEDALERLSALKGRADNKPFPLIAGSVEIIKSIVASLDDKTLNLGQMYWPGALTVILKAKQGLCCRFIVSTEGTLAVRIPGESFALKLAQYLDYPITSTSANPAGYPPPSDAETVLKYFGAGLIDVVIDGGETPGGFPSTIIEVTDEIKVLRNGAVNVL